MINNKEYWDDLLADNNEKRENQTSFFAELAINNLPKWISEDIEDGKMTICDAGCAQGEGTKIWSEQFPNNQTVGIDFSSNAINCAKEKYSECKFQVENIKELSESFDVIFSSNVLEHFYNSSKMIEHLVLHSDKYCILLLPFREYYTVSEHFSYFDFQSFPLKIGEKYELCYFKPMTMVGEQEKYWFGEQILVVYGKSSHLKSMNLSLRNIYNGYIEERCQIIKYYDEIISSLNAEINNISQNLELAENDILKIKKELTDEVDALEERNRGLNGEVDVLEENNRVLKDKIDVLEENNRVSKNKTLEEFYRTTQTSINEAIKYICITQNTTVYKWGLVFRRFIVQFFKSRDKKDFIKWISGKITRKNFFAKSLSEFDYLEIAKHILRTRKQINVDNIVLVDNPNVKLKELKSVVIFASVPFYDVGGGQRSAQFAKAFNTIGYKVYYIYAFPCTEENIPDMFIPTVSHEYIDNITYEWFESIAVKDTITIFEIPYYKFEPYLDIANQLGCHTIYEHIDNWESSLGCLFYNEKIFLKFLRKAEILTVTAKMLGEKITERIEREYIYLANAVNTEIFEPLKNYECPKDLVKGKSKTLIYFGSLWGDWFEWDKIDYLAEQCPDSEINLIGDYSGCIDRVNSAKKNIHFLGLKKQTDLPAYLKNSDVALLPFKNCEIGKYVSPLKIFEYIAMNVRVLATNLDDIKNYPNVYCSDSKEEWVRMLKEDVELQDSSSFISENNWFARCEKLLEKTGLGRNSFPLISIVVLNYNNMGVICRCIDTLLSHKERYNYEIIVVDNGSKDGSYEMLKVNYSEDVLLLQNTQNGCSSGRNLGVNHANGEYICFLDSDQWIVSNYWLDSALQVLEYDQKIGAVAWNAGWFTPGKATGPIVDYLPNRGLESAAIWFRTDIAYLATSGFLMKKDLFNIIGGFDEFYDPTCFEDTDISLKIRNHGFELAYCPYMGIMHLPHQTTQSGSSGHTKLMERNGSYFEEKWRKIQPELLEYYY